MLRLKTAAVLAALCCSASLAVPGGAAADTIRGSEQWVLDMLNVAAAWPHAEGTGVTVAVIDSGVDPRVSDLEGSVIAGPDLTGVRTRPSNRNWGMHGTWMASLIAGHGHGDGDGDGIVGIAPRSKILAIRVIPDRGDPNYRRYEHEPETAIQQSLAAGIDYAVRHGASVISMSIGYVAPSGAVQRALLNAYASGVVVVASAGNSGAPSGADQTPVSFPANYPGVISVGAVDAGGTVAGFSSENLSVELAAPGVSVPAQGRDGQYWQVTGTSPACALVAGVAALIKSRYPGLSPRLVATALTSTTTDRQARGYDSRMGFGIVNAAAALAKAARLSGYRPARIGVAATARFGGGPAGIPAAPVRPRGSGQLVEFALLAFASLALTGAAGVRLAVLRRHRRRPSQAAPNQVPDPLNQAPET
jgi:subtilisin family serine protease